MPTSGDVRRDRRVNALSLRHSLRIRPHRLLDQSRARKVLLHGRCDRRNVVANSGSLNAAAMIRENGKDILVPCNLRDHVFAIERGTETAQMFCAHSSRFRELENHRIRSTDFCGGTSMRA